MSDDSKIEQKIALLLAKAESTTPEEAEALTEHAERLMLRHGIEQVQIEAARRGQERKPEDIIEHEVAFWTGTYARALVGMASEVAVAYGTVRSIQRWRKHSPDRRFYLVGYESDVRSCGTLIASLALQARVAVDAAARREAKDPYGDWAYMSAAERTAWRKSFIVGFGRGAAQRLADTRLRVVREAEEAAPGTAVALVDRKQAVEQHYEELGLRAARSMRLGDGFRDGHLAGRQANVGATAVGGQRALEGAQ